MGNIVASVTVRFEKSKDDGFLSAEVRRKATDGSYVTASNFKPGETAYIFAYRGPDTSITQAIATAGTLKKVGTQDVPVELEGVQFTKLESDGDAAENTAQLSKPATGAGPSLTFYGATVGSTTLGDDLRTLTASQFGIAVATATYSSVADIYALESPATLGGKTDYEILVVLVGKASGT